MPAASATPLPAVADASAGVFQAALAQLLSSLGTVSPVGQSTTTIVAGTVDASASARLCPPRCFL